jgi:hypothetical protein
MNIRLARLLAAGAIALAAASAHAQSPNGGVIGAPSTPALNPALNLADLQDKAAARVNLGLGALTANQIVLGGGGGAAPAVLGSLGTSTSVLHGNGAGAPSWGAVNLGTDVTGSLPIGSVSGTGALAALGVGAGLTTSAGNLTLAPAGLSTLGGIEALSGAVPHAWVSYIDAVGIQHTSQPTAADISGLGALATLGVGAGLTASGGNLILALPGLSTLGGIEALSGAVSHAWVSYIDTAGIQHTSQPTAADISGLGALATLGVGTGLASGGGNLSVSYGTTSGTAAQGNDSRIMGAFQAPSGTASGALTMGTNLLSGSNVSFTGGSITGLSSISSGGNATLGVGSGGSGTGLAVNNTASLHRAYFGTGSTITIPNGGQGGAGSDYIALSEAVSYTGTPNASWAANLLAINNDTVGNNQPGYWLNLTGNVGMTPWQASHAYALGATVNNGGRIYTVATAGTSASSGGPTGTGSSITDGSVVWSYTRPDFSGSRAGLQVYMNFASPPDPASVSDTNKQWQSGLFTNQVSANMGGTGPHSGSSQGFFYASADQMWAFSGATNLSGVIGHEFDVGIFTGASAGQRTGAQIISFGNNQGQDQDNGLRFGSAFVSGSWAPGFKTLISPQNGAVDQNGALFQYTPEIGLAASGMTDTAPQAAYGFDVSAYLFSTAAFQSAGNFLVEPGGQVQSGVARLATSSSGVALDASGSIVQSITMAAAGSGYVVGDQLSDPVTKTILTLLTVNGSGRPLTATINIAGATRLGSPPSTGTLAGGTGQGAVVNYTWQAVSALNLNGSGGPVNSSGIVTASLNTTALPSALSGTVMRAANANGTISRIEADAFGQASHFSSVRYDGTAASPTALQSADAIGSFNAWGYDGTAISASPQAAFRIFTSQNWASGAHGTYADVATTPNGSTTLASVLRFEADGGITTPGVTGGDKGLGTINAGTLYGSGNPVLTDAPVDAVYTSGAAIDPACHFAVLNSSSAQNYSLLSGADGHTVSIYNYGSGTASVVLTLGGTSSRVTVVQGSVLNVKAWAAQSTWILAN